tara:strand:- start:184 stop:519 length:336 start_codon:yes stop_codon:yes gene_type:complete
MSIRRDVGIVNSSHTNAQQLRMEIENMRTAAAMNAMEMPSAMATNDAAEAAAHFDALNETEKSAASIGTSPEELKPIGWMNTAHYTTLLKKNALDGRLTQQIEAYKVVSGA